MSRMRRRGQRMKPRMRNRWQILARSLRIILLALSVLVLLWQVRSFFRSDRLTYSRLYLDGARDVKTIYEAQFIRGRLVLSVREISRDWASAEVAARFLRERTDEERLRPRFRWYIEPPRDQFRHANFAPIVGFESVRFLSSMVHTYGGVELPAHDDNHFVGFPLWVIVLALALPSLIKIMNDRSRKQPVLTSKVDPHRFKHRPLWRNAWLRSRTRGSGRA